MENGIYFNLSDEEYHQIERLSASGIKDLLISLPTFWARSWMNPQKTNDDTPAKILGRAYHAAIFEPETVDQRFVRELNYDDFPDMLTTDSAVKDCLANLGEVKTRQGELALDRALRLQSLGFEKPIKSLVDADFQENLNGRDILGGQYWDQMMIDINRIIQNPEIEKLVIGGASEVTILWTCEHTGINMKSRIDKLKSDCFVDLKSFANKSGKPVNQVIVEQVNYYKYYLSMRSYQVAISKIKTDKLPVVGDASPEEFELVEKLREKATPHQPWLVFQEKGGVPNIMARKLKLHSLPDGVEEQSAGSSVENFKQGETALCVKADIEMRHAMKMYLQAMDVFGENSEWYPFDMVGEISDDDFSDYFLNGVPT